MKKQVIFLVVLALALPLAAFADNSNILNFTSGGGTLTGDSSGFTLTGSTLTTVNGFGYGYITGANLGSVTFTTGPLGSTGNITDGSTLVAGGSILITGNGNDPNVTGTLFQGSFDSAIWSTDKNGNYVLTGDVSGASGNNTWEKGTLTFEINTAPDQGFYGSSSGPSVGYTVVAVPEPAELTLLGTGLLGLLGAIRRKMKA
jgi:hypothetical protein